MTIAGTIRSLRASGLSDAQILSALEHMEAERLAEKREHSRIRQQNHRARNARRCDKRDERDTPSSPSPPSMVSPITPSLTTPSSPPPPNIRLIEEDFEKFWLAYPKRDGPNPKHPAREKFVKLVRGGLDPGVLIAGAKSYAAAEAKNVGTTFIAQTTKWLNQRYWEGYPARPAEIVDEGKFRELREKYEAKRARME